MRRNQFPEGYSRGLLNYLPTVKVSIIVLCLCFPIHAVYPQEEEEINYFTLRGGLGIINTPLLKGTSYGLTLDTNFLFIPQLAVGIRTGGNLHLLR
jgi:hypothetical protein